MSTSIVPTLQRRVGLALRFGAFLSLLWVLLFSAPGSIRALAQVSLSPVASSPASPTLPPSPALTLSILRLVGALAVVMAVFFGGLWLFRNWQRFLLPKGPSPKLNVLEVKSLGQRHALYIIGYEQQRMLLAASPSGLSMLTQLPPALEAPESKPAAADSRPNFALRRNA
jgi:flagellar biogenesis protein FliO